jgi:sarcosine oxidase
VKTYRIIVLGLGGIGSGAVYWASRRLGDDVLGVEQFALGHPNGGSEDHSRIIRLSYHTPEYVELARSAYSAWAELERESGRQVVLKTGGLDLAPAGATIGLGAYDESLTAAGVPFERLDAAEIMSRWPAWRLSDDVEALYQEDSGIAMASIANATHREMAVEHGARLIESATVSGIREEGGSVTVTINGERHQCESLVVAAGAWTNRVLAPFGVSFPLEVTQEQVVYLTPGDEELFRPDRFPVWIWMTEPSFYGFPVFGEPAVKIAWDRCEIVTDPDTRSHEPRADVIKAVTGFANQHLPAANGGVHLSKTCLYTLTPDRDFIVDRVPGTERVYVAVGAGHAFKFASVLGRALTDLALDGDTDLELSAFRADRSILGEAEPARSYMV